jgi:DNA-binding transcriptional ArsR family regulator
MALAQHLSPVTSSALRVRVDSSVAVELFWATMTTPEGRYRVDHPAIEEVAATRPGLLDEITAMWGSRDVAPADGCGATWSFPELLILADRAGVLGVVDFHEMVTMVAAEARRAAPEPRLATETDRDRAVIRDRLAALRTDAGVRRRWLRTLLAMADALEEQWAGAGRAMSSRACRARASQLPWADEAAVLRDWAHSDFGGVFEQALAQAASDGQEVLVVPSYWSGNGVLFDLPHHLLLGIPAQPGARESRSRTEPLARGVRALADPTRLAIVDYLVGTPRTVGELAEDFQLAQPTISRHVRLLREAGLLTETRQGNAVVLGANQVAIAALLDGIGAALVTRTPVAVASVGAAPEAAGPA